MQCSDAGKAFIKRWEVLELVEYLDAAGLPTIGYGHRLAHSGMYPNGITQEQADQSLAEDLAPVEVHWNSVLAFHGQQSLHQHEFDALCSFAFNVGIPAAMQSTLCLQVCRGDLAAAADEFLKWDHITVNGTKVVSEGLLHRRQAELALFKGDTTWT